MASEEAPSLLDPPSGAAAMAVSCHAHERVQLVSCAHRNYGLTASKTDKNKQNTRKRPIRRTSQHTSLQKGTRGHTALAHTVRTRLGTQRPCGPSLVHTSPTRLQALTQTRQHRTLGPVYLHCTVTCAQNMAKPACTHRSETSVVAHPITLDPSTKSNCPTLPRPLPLRQLAMSTADACQCRNERRSSEAHKAKAGLGPCRDSRMRRAAVGWAAQLSTGREESDRVQGRA